MTLTRFLTCCGIALCTHWGVAKVLVAVQCKLSPAKLTVVGIFSCILISLLAVFCCQ